LFRQVLDVTEVERLNARRGSMPYISHV